MGKDQFRSCEETKSPTRSEEHSKSRISTAKSTDTNYTLKRAMELSQMPGVRQFQARELVKSDSSMTLQ